MQRHQSRSSDNKHKFDELYSLVKNNDTQCLKPVRNKDLEVESGLDKLLTLVLV